MKKLLSTGALLFVLLWLTPAVHAQSTVQPGTQVHLTLVNGLTTSVAHDGDPFTAIVAEPVFSGNQLLIPADAKIHGTVAGVTRPKWFGMNRGGASINLIFDSIEVESRVFPVQLSILSFYSGDLDSGKKRKDLKTTEGVVAEEKRDLKQDVRTGGLGAGSGALPGLTFSNVARSTVIGLVGTSVYIVAQKGKEVELPDQTGMVVRTDSTVTLPSPLLDHASFKTTTGGH